MSKIIIIGLFLVLSGCAGGDYDVNPEHSYRIVKIEGHEYIFVSRRPWAGNMAIAHNANCPAHNDE